MRNYRAFSLSIADQFAEMFNLVIQSACNKRLIKFNNSGTKNEKVILKSEFLATTFRFLDQTANQGEKKGSP